MQRPCTTVHGRVFRCLCASERSGKICAGLVELVLQDFCVALGEISLCDRSGSIRTKLVANVR